MSGERPNWGPPPTTVIICGTVLAALAMASVVLLTLAGQDSEIIFRLINIGINALGLLAGVGGLLYAGSAAKSAKTAESRLSNDAIVTAVTQAINDAPASGTDTGSRK